MSEITRKEFLRIIKWAFAATGFAVIFAPIVAFFYPPNLEETPSEPISVGTINELPLNTSKTIQYGRYPALIINTNKGLRAYSAVCTHFACIVKWDSSSDEIVCPCHEGYFDPYDGHVISGPPPIGLEQLPVVLRDVEIFVGGKV